MTQRNWIVAARGLASADVVVWLGMALVAMALGAGLHLQMSLPLGLAAAVALSAYAALLAFHALLRRSSALRAEVARLQTELDGLKGVLGVEAPAASVGRTLVSASPVRPRVPEAKGLAPAAGVATAPPPAAEARGGRSSPEASREKPASADPSSRVIDGSRSDPAKAGEPAKKPELKPTLHDVGAAFSKEALQELWSFRPSSPPELPAGPPPEALSAPPVTTREADVELIQDMIKKLAAEVNASDPPAPQSQAPLPRTSDSTEAAIEVSLEALRSAAETMRAARPVAREPRPSRTSAEPRAPHASARHAEPEAAGELSARGPSQPDAAPALQGRLATLAEAITAARIDVLLEPILGLEDQRTRHFEVSIRLRDASGEPLHANRDGAELRGTGLLPMLDCAGISRAAQVARRLADRGRKGALLSQLSAEALGDDAFLNEFADAYRAHDGFADQLVMAFGQSDVRSLTSREWQTLADMRDLGFRFALQAVTDLDMDFEALTAKGFAFVKLDADVFLHGMPAPGGVIAAADICSHLAQLGLTLIVGGIDDETKLARIFGFGALLGQGQMFGGPRPVKAEALGPHPAAA